MTARDAGASGAGGRDRDRGQGQGRVEVAETTVRGILTRTSGYLKGVTSHSLQPYRGCTLGSALCGVACYVRHNHWVTRGRPWGGFLEARTNAAAVYRESFERERAWARGRGGGRFSVFLSSSTEPFVPQERRFGVTRSVLGAMCELPPDELIVQTHSHRVLDAEALLRELATKTDLRVHVSIETDREEVPGLPPHASPVERRFGAVERLADTGLAVVVAVSPLLPIRDPDAFFGRIARAGASCILDHFVGGDGSEDGRRTKATALPAAMESVEPGSAELAYRDRMEEIARRRLPGRVGIGPEGFAGRFE